MEDIELTGEEAFVAHRIRAIDRELDVLEQERDTSVLGGMKAPNFAQIFIQQGQDRADTRLALLHAERAELAARLRELVEGA